MTKYLQCVVQGSHYCIQTTPNGSYKAVFVPISSYGSRYKVPV